MVVEFCSENCGVSISSMSPRISFSHDFSQSDVIPVEKHPLRSNSSGLNSSIDFDFCVLESLELESSSADELFSDGVILPTQIKNKNNNNVLLKQRNQLAPLPPPPQPQLPPSQTICENASSTTIKSSKKESHKDRNNLSDEVDEKHSSKSFWRFKRSSSCGSGYGRSLCPLPLLSRSNSTGSSPSSVKRIPLSKEGHNVKQNSQKRSSSLRSSHSLTSSHNHQKPPLKRSHGPHGAYANNGVRVSPVLNVPSANLFGLGSIFSNNRDKSKKK